MRLSEQILARYPKVKSLPDLSHRPYRVDYDLAYDGGGARWSGWYRTLLGAKFSIFWNMHFASWGGSAILVKVDKCS